MPSPKTPRVCVSTTIRARLTTKSEPTFPLESLVGHKGIGKSALFQVAMSEDQEEGQLPIFLRPDDVSGIEPP
jgi:hypothetical protein